MSDANAHGWAANFVAGEWVPSRTGRTYPSINPWRPREVIGEFPLSDSADIEAAVTAAQQAAPAWSRLPAAKRCAFLSAAAELVHQRSETLAQDMTREMGKPLREARLEISRVAATFRFFSGEGWRPFGELYEQAATGAQIFTRRRPLGVVALITPWNFPASIPAWKLAPALAYGNTAVLKLASEAPLSGLHLARIFGEVGLPRGVLNVVTGSGSETGEALLTSPQVRAVSFTGSLPVGQHVRDQASRLGKRVQLELGGHNPLIVHDDADLTTAVHAAYAGAFWSAGQKCTATRRIYVHDSIYDAFRSQLLRRIAGGVVGDPMDPKTEVGPLVNEDQMQQVLAAIERGLAEGGTLLTGGARINPEAYLVAPTVFEGVADEAFLSCEEVFGPVTSLYRYSTLDEAIERANSVRFGLSASVFTTSLATAKRCADALQAGILHINSQTAGADVHVPFGGLKASGFGPHEQGRAALDFYTDQVTIYSDL